MGIYPFAVGLAFFIPLDLSFSVWVFYLYWKLQRVLGSAFALPHGFPYASEQSFGAYVGLGMMAIWTARRHLVQVARKCLGVGARVDDTHEPLSYRGTVIWLLASLAFLFGFCQRAGMSFWVIALFFGLYYMLAIGITRVRAELGSPVHDQHFAGADEMTYAFVGAKPLGTSNMTMLSYFYFFNRAYDCLLMPHQLEGLKIAERAEIQYRRFGGVMVFATVLGIGASIWGYLHFAYQGEINTGWAGEEAFQRLEGWLAHPSGTNGSVITAIGVGFLGVGRADADAGAVSLDAVARGWLCRHHDVDNEFFLVLYLRQLCVEMADCQARRAAEFPKSGAVFSGVGAWGVCGHDVLGGVRDSHGAVDVYYD